jgi:MOSC domain-containing protein YiiM
MTAKVLEILLAENAGGILFPSPSAKFEAGKGIVGDRYYSAQGTFSANYKDTPGSEVTLIEQEQINAFNTVSGLNYQTIDFRRNIVTENINLNLLVDKEFYIGTVKLKGILLCEPCAYLAKRLGPQVIEHMSHKAGLRAQIIVSGDVAVSDTIRLA